MAVINNASSQAIFRILRFALVSISALVAIFGEVAPTATWPIHQAHAGAARDAHDASEYTLIEALAKPFSVQIDALPAMTTTVTLQRVHYEPGVELAVQPIDGPRLLLIESGILSLAFARSGASRFPSGLSEDAVSLAAGDEYQAVSGEFVLIPAHVPLQLANQSDEPVVWLQIQAETPPEICACGEDLTGSTTNLLASQTLEQPIAVPAMLTVANDEIAPQQVASVPEDGLVQLISPLESGARLEISGDGVLLNATDADIPVYIVTLGAPPATT